MSPVSNKLIPYTAIMDGSLTLHDFFIMNEHLSWQHDYDILSQMVIDKYKKDK